MDKHKARYNAIQARHGMDLTAGEESQLLELFRHNVLNAHRPESGMLLAGYWPIRNEIDPRPLMALWAAEGGRTALPVTPAQGRPLEFRLWLPDRTDMVDGPYGIMEPGSSAPVVTPDLLLVPLAAFDRRGYRLGYGGGFYDRTLESLRAQKQVTAIGLAYASQESPEPLPVEPHDTRLDAVLTEQEWIVPLD